MPSPSPTGRSGQPWLTWGVPVAVLVLLAAVAGGIAMHTLNGKQSQGVSPSRPESTAPRLPTPVSPVVEFSPDALGYPDSARVRQVLQIHFDAINFKSYEQWRPTVVEQKKRELPEPKWRKSYATTRDANIMVQRIEPAPDHSLRVLLTFDSMQDPSDAPAQLREPCVHWRVVYPLVHEDSVLQLDTGRLPGGALVGECR